MYWWSLLAIVPLLHIIVATIPNDFILNTRQKTIRCYRYDRHGNIRGTCKTTADKGCYFYRGPTLRNYAGDCGTMHILRRGETFVTLYDFADAQVEEFGRHCDTDLCNIETNSGLREAMCWKDKLSNTSTNHHRYQGVQLQCHCSFFCRQSRCSTWTYNTLPLCIYKSTTSAMSNEEPLDSNGVSSYSWCSAGHPILSVKWNSNNKVVRRLACGYMHFCNDPKKPFINDCITSPPLFRSERQRARLPFYM